MVQIEFGRSHHTTHKFERIAPNSRENDDQEKEALFKVVILKSLFDSVRNGLHDAGFSDEECVEFLKEIGKLDEADIFAAISIPHELQEKIFSALADQLHKKKISVQKIVDTLHKQAKTNGYTIGFHVSNKDFRPTYEIDKKGVEMTKWDVQGSEADHRDADLVRAYYSLDYSNLYRKKNGNYLYLVRAETGRDSGHKRDNDGSWGRSSTLSIITRLDLKQVDQNIEDRIKFLKEKKRGQ